MATNILSWILLTSSWEADNLFRMDNMDTKQM